ncbi:MAG: hypothetical protein I3274_05620, partial [Candidatus Moeniiplasma glomeromycotorum]|nr:hypothetical protein [Candidatus Moeniiplasma glomeromycotorum]
ILADRNNFEKLAIPLVGGEIFAGSCPKDKIAEGIIRGVVNQLEKCQELRDISLIDWEGNPKHYFLEKVQQIKDELFDHSDLIDEKEFIGVLKSDKGKGLGVKVKDVRENNKDISKNVAIVNAANTKAEFGGGISGAISEQVGDKTKIDQKARKLIEKFYFLIQKENNGKDNNQKEVVFEAKMIGANNLVTNEAGEVQQGEYHFEIKDTKKHLLVDYLHPFFLNKERPAIAKFVGGKGGIVWYKIKLKSENINNDLTTIAKIKKGDFFEIEEMKDNNDTPTQNDNNQNNNDNQDQNGNGSNNDKSDNNQNNQKNSDWKKKLNLGEKFPDNKITEWKNQKGFNTPDKVEKLLSSVKNNPKFTNLIKEKYRTQDLNTFLTNKTPKEIIILIKRFEYNNLGSSDRENKNKKIRAYYQKINQLAKNGKLTEEQINNYLYKQAIGEINESSIQEGRNRQESIKPSKNNLAQTAVIVGIIFLVLAIIFFLVLFSKKKKKNIKF